MGLGLAPHTIVIIALTALAGIAGLLCAMRQEQHEQHERRAQQRVAAEVGRMELPDVRRLLQQGLLTPNPQFWQVVEEGLVRFRPSDRDGEAQRQRPLQEVRLRLMS